MNTSSEPTKSSSAQRNVAILVFDDVEVLDFAGPFEVFSVTGRTSERTPFSVYTVAENARPVLARNSLSINPRYSFENCPAPQILVVPGGWGTRPLLKNVRVLDWIKSTATPCEIVSSVCTGSLLLAKIGLLSGLGATTHHGALDLLQSIDATVDVRRQQRVVDNGRIITSGGISAGIDMALHIVVRLLGAEEARCTAAYMEYDWRG